MRHKYLILCIFLSLSVFFSRKTQEEEAVVATKKSLQGPTKSELKSNAALAEEAKKEDSSTPERSIASGPIISDYDPIRTVLRKYNIVFSDHYKVGYDTWFFAKELSVVPERQYDESKHGSIVEKGPGFFVVATKQSKDKFAPLVLSHSTNTIVPLSGEIYVEYDPESLDQAKNLIEDKGYQVLTPTSLKNINRFVVKSQPASRVLDGMQELSSYIGQEGIRSVEAGTIISLRPN
jgi:hypothetical protein